MNTMCTPGTSQAIDRALGVQAVRVTEEIPIVARDLSDVDARRLYFFPYSGHVLIKKLEHVSNDSLAGREREYARRFEDKKIAGDVEPFTSTALPTDPQPVCGRFR